MNVNESTIKYDYCIGCGICASVCQKNAIQMTYETGKYISKLLEEKCVNCGMCTKFCPHSLEKKTEERNLLNASDDKNAFGMQNAEYLLCKDKNVENVIKSASGGVITALVLELMKSKQIDCVIQAQRKMACKGQEHFQVCLNDKIDDVQKSRGSIYGPLCFEDVLNALKNKNGKVLVIGTPCVVRGIKNLILNNPLYKNIKVITVALICSHNVTGLYADYVGEVYGIDEKTPYYVDFRAKSKEQVDQNHFYTSYYNEEKQILFMDRYESVFTQTWRNYYFAMPTCVFCGDFWGREADISVKDAWGMPGVPHRYGSSIVICRNKEMLKSLYNVKDLFIEK